MLVKRYRLLPPGGVWLLASAALFVLSALLVLGSDNSRMSTLGLVWALVAVVLLAVAFAGRRPQ